MTERPSAILARHREAVVALAEKHGASDVRVFGSIARGDDEPGSDVDLLVTWNRTASLLDASALVDALEELLGTRVDVVSEAGLTERHDQIRQQTVSLSSLPL